CARALGETRRLLQQDSRRRRLCDEGETAIGVNRDDNRNNEPGHLLVLRARVELLAELHNVDLRLAQCGTDRRRGGGLACFDLQLDLCGYFLWRCHKISSFGTS